MTRFYGTIPEDPARCVEAVRDPNGWHRYQCRNKRTHGDFCKTHSPEAKAARKAKQTARYERQSLEFDINAARREVVNVALQAYRQQTSFDDLERAVATLQSLLDKLA